MSASLYWEPLDREMHELNIGAPSSFMGAFERVFGDSKPTLRPEHLPKLEAMRDMTEYAEWRAAYSQLIDAIEMVGAIQIVAVY